MNATKSSLNATKWKRRATNYRLNTTKPDVNATIPLKANHPYAGGQENLHFLPGKKWPIAKARFLRQRILEQWQRPQPHIE